MSGSVVAGSRTGDISIYDLRAATSSYQTLRANHKTSLIDSHAYLCLTGPQVPASSRPCSEGLWPLKDLADAHYSWRQREKRCSRQRCAPAVQPAKRSTVSNGDVRTGCLSLKPFHSEPKQSRMTYSRAPASVTGLVIPEDGRHLISAGSDGFVLE